MCVEGGLLWGRYGIDSVMLEAKAFNFATNTGLTLLHFRFGFDAVAHSLCAHYAQSVQSLDSNGSVLATQPRVLRLGTWSA